MFVNFDCANVAFESVVAQARALDPVA